MAILTFPFRGCLRGVTNIYACTLILLCDSDCGHITQLDFLLARFLSVIPGSFYRTFSHPLQHFLDLASELAHFILVAHLATVFVSVLLEILRVIEGFGSRL